MKYDCFYKVTVTTCVPDSINMFEDEEVYHNHGGGVLMAKGFDTDEISSYEKLVAPLKLTSAECPSQPSSTKVGGQTKNP